MRRLPARALVAGLGRSAPGSAGGRAADVPPKARRARRARRCSRSRHCSSACCRRSGHVVPVRPQIEPPADRFGIDVAHELADILELPLAAAPRRDRPRPRRIASASRSGNAASAASSASRFGSSRIKRFAQVLQRVHFRLAPGLRWRPARPPPPGRPAASSATVPACGVGACVRRAGASFWRKSGRVMAGLAIGTVTLCYDSRASILGPGLAAATAPQSPSMTAFAQAAPEPVSSSTAAPSAHGGQRRPLSAADRGNRAASPNAVLAAAKAGGATAAETEVSQAVGQSVTVRRGEVETVAYNRDKGIGVTVYLGQRRGHASTADFSPRRHARDRRQGTGDRAVHGGGPGGRARRPGPAGARLSRSRSLRSVGTDCRRGGGARSRGRGRSAGRRSPAHQHRGLDRRLERVGVRLRQHARVSRRLPQHAAPHRLLGDRRPRRRRRDAARLLVHGGPRCVGSAGRIRGRAHRGRTHRAAPVRAPAGNDRVPGAVRGAGGRRPHRRVRGGGVGRRALPQVVVPARFARARRCSRRWSRSARSPTSRAPAAARRSTTRAWRRCRGTSSGTASSAAISSAATLRASSA